MGTQECLQSRYGEHWNTCFPLQDAFHSSWTPDADDVEKSTQAQEDIIMSKESASCSGIGLGGIIAAVVLSWSYNHSILWAIIHGIFGWFYIIYAVLKYNL